MAVYQEEPHDGKPSASTTSRSHADGGGGGALEDAPPEDSVGVDGVVIAKVGGYTATRFVPLCEGCGGRVRSLALAPGKALMRLSMDDDTTLPPARFAFFIFFSLFLIFLLILCVYTIFSISVESGAGEGRPSS